MSVKKCNVLLCVGIVMMLFMIGLESVKADVYKNYFNIEMSNQEYNTL